jgi:DNA-binding CsgD family transcriptional regulator
MNLSEVKQTILQKTLEGLRPKEIASIVHLSPRTVEAHLNAIKLEYKCKTIPQLAHVVSRNRGLDYQKELIETVWLMRVIKETTALPSALREMVDKKIAQFG